jgi:hypothetical protein
MKKKIVRLTPPNYGSLDENDRHYVASHFRFGATTFQTVPAVIAYHSNRAIAQYDLNGTFRERPDCWRFVITRWDDAGDDGHSVGWLDERVRLLFFKDREKCIGEVSSCEVEEATVVDRLHRQTALVKYVFRYLPSQFGPLDDFEQYYRDVHLPALSDVAQEASGMRLLLTNRVAQEAETAVRPDGLTEYTGGYLATVGTYRYEEYYFDNVYFADAFFRRTEVLALLRDTRFGRVPGYQVEEKCGVDRR